MGRIKNINYVFLFTVLISIFAAFIPFTRFVKSYIGLLIISQIIIVIPSIFYLLHHRVNYKEAVRFRKIRPISVLLLIVLTLFLIPVMSFVNALSLLYVKDTTTDMMTIIMQNSPFLLSIFAIAIVPCILEESVYRGIFYNEYSKYNKVGAIFLSAFLFGVLHGNFNQFTYAFFMGILFALVIEATDSIISTMIIHFIINGNSVLMLYLVDYVNNTYQGASQDGSSSTMALIEKALGQNDASTSVIAENATTVVGGTLGSVIQTLGPVALISGIIAFYIYRTIALKENRWEHVKGIFIKKDICVQEKLISRNSFTYFIPLYIAIGICIFSMIMNELQL